MFFLALLRSASPRVPLPQKEPKRSSPGTLVYPFNFHFLNETNSLVVPTRSNSVSLLRKFQIMGPRLHVPMVLQILLIPISKRWPALFCFPSLSLVFDAGRWGVTHKTSEASGLGRDGCKKTSCETGKEKWGLIFLITFFIKKKSNSWKKPCKNYRL